MTINTLKTKKYKIKIISCQRKNKLKLLTSRFNLSVDLHIFLLTTKLLFVNKMYAVSFHQ